MVQNLVTKKHPNPFSKAVALALTVALLAMMVTPAFAIVSEYSADYYDYDSAVITYNHPTNQIYQSAMGFTFQADEDTIENVVVYGRTVGTVSGAIIGKIGYLNDGTTLTTIPNGTVLGTSTNTYALTSISGVTYETLIFNFTAFAVTIGGNYSFWMEMYNGTNAYNHGITFKLDHVSPIHEGLVVRFYTSSWHYITSDDMCHIIYSEDEIDGEDPYVPPEEEDPVVLTDMDATIAAFVAFMVPLIVMMLPALLLCFITKRVDKWLILLGVTIGAGLGYYFGMVPLWLVFLVTIGLIGMAYQSVRGGG